MPAQRGGLRGVYRGGGTRTPDLRFWRPPLYQLSYAPEFLQDCSRGLSEILLRMSDHEQENLEPQEQGHDQDALDEQHRTGYMEDEGEEDPSVDEGQ